ncbi:AsnC family protein [Halomonas korlensis]|uniref:siroheme decarboxylase n=1 Tax=Halomonas korlensis TaxID=463301 RepID=A0A1I7GU22_9GAMM|nr:AsnC family protein [Halomonas korlensis]SFU51962.1 transcriptional regulator, AsnC family [Halomonas korlensis]
MSAATPLPLDAVRSRDEPAAHRRLRALLEQGMPLTPRPWQTLAEQAGMAEEQVMACVRRWQAEGMIKRLGLVVRHRRLGIQANAMMVWDVPDEQVEEIGRRLAQEAAVTLCYRRPRRLPEWPYNLFCMIHGARRERVLAELAMIVERLDLGELEHRVLFSTHAYRQCGGRYVGEGAI